MSVCKGVPQRTIAWCNDRSQVPIMPQEYRRASFWWLMAINNALTQVLGYGLERFATVRTPAGKLTTKDPAKPQGVRIIDPVWHDEGRLVRPEYAPNQRCAFLPQDQCSIGKSGMNFAKFALGIAVEDVMDPSHRCTNDLKKFATDALLQPLFVVMQVSHENFPALIANRLPKYSS